MRAGSQLRFPLPFNGKASMEYTDPKRQTGPSQFADPREYRRGPEFACVKAGRLCTVRSWAQAGVATTVRRPASSRPADINALIARLRAKQKAGNSGWQRGGAKVVFGHISQESGPCRNRMGMDSIVLNTREPYRLKGNKRRGD